jgi:hypothetical protein
VLADRIKTSAGLSGLMQQGRWIMTSIGKTSVLIPFTQRSAFTEALQAKATGKRTPGVPRTPKPHVKHPKSTHPKKKPPASPAPAHRPRKPHTSKRPHHTPKPPGAPGAAKKGGSSFATNQKLKTIKIDGIDLESRVLSDATKSELSVLSNDKATIGAALFRTAKATLGPLGYGISSASGGGGAKPDDKQSQLLGLMHDVIMAVDPSGAEQSPKLDTAREQIQVKKITAREAMNTFVTAIVEAEGASVSGDAGVKQAKPEAHKLIASMLHGRGLKTYEVSWSRDQDVRAAIVAGNQATGEIRAVVMIPR